VWPGEPGLDDMQRQLRRREPAVRADHIRPLLDALSHQFLRRPQLTGTIQQNPECTESFVLSASFVALSGPEGPPRHELPHVVMSYWPHLLEFAALDTICYGFVLMALRVHGEWI
jgi:hypothetical protein